MVYHKLVATNLPIEVNLVKRQHSNAAHAAINFCLLKCPVAVSQIRNKVHEDINIINLNQQLMLAGISSCMDETDTHRLY